MAIWEKPATFDVNSLVLGGKKLASTLGFAGVHPSVLSALDDGRIKPAGMVTARISLEDVVEGGFEELIRNKDEHIKIIVGVAAIGVLAAGMVSCSSPANETPAWVADTYCSTMCFVTSDEMNLAVGRDGTDDHAVDAGLRVGSASSSNDRDGPPQRSENHDTRQAHQGHRHRGRGPCPPRDVCGRG